MRESVQNGRILQNGMGGLGGDRLGGDRPWSPHPGHERGRARGQTLVTWSPESHPAHPSHTRVNTLHPGHTLVTVGTLRNALIDAEGPELCPRRKSRA